MIGRVLAVLAAVALAGALVFAYFDDATHRPVAPQGDMLGTESGESFSSYAQRAGASLAEADETAYALVTFAGPLDPAEAAAVLEPVDRVNAMIVALAASAAFMTPISSPVNTLVLGPGGYRFGDFFKVGVLLQGVILVVTLLLVPLLFPF